MLEYILKLSNLLPKLATLLVAIVDRELEAEGPRTEYDATYANSASVIGACTRCVAERPAKEWADIVDLSKWTSRFVEKWGWSGQALGGLAALVRSRYVDFYVQHWTTFDTVF